MDTGINDDFLQWLHDFKQWCNQYPNAPHQNIDTNLLLNQHKKAESANRLVSMKECLASIMI